MTVTAIQQELQPTRQLQTSTLSIRYLPEGTPVLFLVSVETTGSRIVNACKKLQNASPSSLQTPEKQSFCFNALNAVGSINRINYRHRNLSTYTVDSHLQDPMTAFTLLFPTNCQYQFTNPQMDG